MLTLLFSSTAILFAGLILSLYVYSTRNFNYWKKKKVFFIKPWPIFGNFLSVFLGQKSVSDWSWELYKSARADYFGVFIFDQPHLILKSPEMVKNVLIKDFSYFQDRQVYINPDDDILKHALFFSKNPEWKIMRSKVSPIYTSGKLKMMFPLILNESQAMVGFLENKGSLESLEIKDICSKYSTNVIAKCAFSVDAGCFERENAHFRMISKRLFDFRMTTAIRQLSAFFLPGLVKLFKLRFFEKSVVDEMKNIFSTVLDERNKMSTLKGNDLADMLLEIRKKKSKEEFCKYILHRLLKFAFDQAFLLVYKSASANLRGVKYQRKFFQNETFIIYYEDYEQRNVFATVIEYNTLAVN